MKRYLHILTALVFAFKAQAGEDAGEAARSQRVATIGKDTRQPSRADVSGAWTSGPNLTGYTFQLEQRGNRVTGRGYHWGCLGIYDLFDLTGSYKSGILSLTFSDFKRGQKPREFKFATERGQPRFIQQKTQYPHEIMPFHELRRPDK